MLLKSLQIYPVYEVPEQVRRRIAISGTTGALDSLSDIVAQNGHAASGTTQYQNALADIVGFDATPQGFERPIVNISGDDTSVTQFAYEARDTGIYNFVMVLVANPINESRSQEVQYVVTGYTSQGEQSLISGLLPDDLVLYINDIFGMQTTYRRNAFGERVLDENSFRMIDNYVLSRSLAFNDYHEASINAINITKSADMVKKMNLGKGEKIIPTDNTLFAPVASTAPTLLAGNLTQPTNFVTAISNSYLRTMGRDNELSMVDSFFEGTGGTAVEQELQSLGVVRTFTNYELVKAFRSALSTNTGNAKEGWSISQRANFRLRDLKVALVNPQMVDQQITDSLFLAARRGMGQIDSTDSWIGRNGYSSMGNLVSYDLSMQLGAILSRNLVGRVSFMFDNRQADFTNMPVLNVYEDSVEAIANAQLPRLLGQRLLSDLHAMFVKVTKHNHIRCAVQVIALLGTVTRVEILMDGENQAERYTYASFMSARLHNGNTTSLEYAGRLAESTCDLMNAIEDGFGTHERGIGKDNLFSNIPSAPNQSGNSILDSGSSNTILGSNSLKRNSLLD
ncbi:hypothetical protein BIZ78_gp239 [Erwinia phage vB_EamM_Caitlin]|uniref:hypothetical protein n=1 Tax=Erwinia phage vB_EamM_Caitlin TaxID=1883379 RepID=UPI00081CE308|nr:hypothetical protein BIZ78_gp239 [Erwinia phage vB_EamM_Caitlin]ANZ48336.1 hypothetical protein CAITLIN_41 [Erwinia phage vB_EamM_Caitlin]